MSSEKPTHTPEPAGHPSDDDVVISARNLGKMYHLYDRPQDRLKQAFLWGKKQLYREFWALRDISFEVRRGETLGIIGRNGAGKSTLLQVLAGTLAPTAGEAQVKGRVAALLELGSGFNPEFTGRENVYLNGAILGFSRQEMDARFDEITAFADIGQFIDQPVKLYSSGMFVRLAFAVQVCIDPDILLVDEALAVGDIFFRQKCYQRIEALRERGGSIILVSHAMLDVEQFCQRALLLDRGQMLFCGPASEAVKRYYLIEQKDRVGAAIAPPQPLPAEEALAQNELGFFWPPAEAFLDISGVPQVSNGWARCTGVAVYNQHDQPCRTFQQGEMACFFYEFELLQDIEVPIGGMVIQDDKGIIVHGKNTLQYGSDVPIYAARGSRLRFRQDIILEIRIGEYTFEVGLATMNLDDYQHRDIYPHSALNEKIVRLCHLPAVCQFAVIPRPLGKPVQLLHHGAANLPGQCQLRISTPPR